MQNTIKKQTSIEGIGIQTGKPVHVSFKPADTNQGIVYKRIDINPLQVIAVNDFDFGPHQRRTTISKNGVEIHTVEHLMAALRALSIDNLIVEVNSIEMPGLDGSALEYYTCLKEAGIDKQDKPRRVIRVDQPVWCESGDMFLGIFPYDGFKISYLLESPSPSIGRQSITLDINEEIIGKELISARTFCLKEEAEMLLKMGFGKGASTDNTLVMDKDGPMNNVLRFSDEPVRHKILDLIGDLYLLGAPVEGRIIAIGSGHDMNRKLVEKVKQRYFGSD